MAIDASVRRNFKPILYLFFLLTFALLLYYHYVNWNNNNKLYLTHWKMAFDGLAADHVVTDAIIVRQTTRKKIMEEYCLTHPYETNLSSSRENLGYIIVDDEHKILYCTIPKVSTTTWKNVFFKLRGKKRVPREHEVHEWHLWKRLYEYTAEERAIRLQTYFKFLFVREPLKRLLSAYKKKFTGNDLKVSKSSRVSIIKAYRPKDLNKNSNLVNFSEFIQYYSNDIPRNQHWRQYDKLCHPCVVNYSFIGHLETLAEDAPLLLKMAGIDDRVTFPPVHRSTNSSEVLEYYSKVPTQYITRIGQLYRSDFEMFGYDFPGEIQPLLNNDAMETSDRQSNNKLQ